MKKVYFETDARKTYLEDVGGNVPIFAKRHGKFKGSVIKAPEGWILNLGADFGANGHFEYREDCIMAGEHYGYEFFIED